MSEYKVTSRLGDREWQIDSQARQHSFHADSIHDDGSDIGPNPVEYLLGAVNSCIVMSAGMVAKSHALDVQHFKLVTHAQTRELGHGRSDVAGIQIEVHMETTMDAEVQEKFVKRVLSVSTVYQSLIKAIPIKVQIA